VKAGSLTERVAFDEPIGLTNAFGGTSEAWAERHACCAQWLYGRGDEGVQAAREAGRKAYKIRLRSCEAARAITESYRMRDVRRGLPWGVTSDTLPGNRWNVIEVDAITDRAWVFVTIEGPQA